MIEKILNIQKINYSSFLNQNDLKKRIESFFSTDSLAIEGRFTNENKFIASDKWNIIGWNMPNLKRKSAYLKGEVIETEKGSVLKVYANPNSILSFFSIFSVLAGVSIAIIAVLYQQYNEPFIIGLLTILMGVLCYLSGILLRNRLLNNFSKYLGLKK